jgi:hypothetical protein
MRWSAGVSPFSTHPGRDGAVVAELSQLIRRLALDMPELMEEVVTFIERRTAEPDEIDDGAAPKPIESVAPTGPMRAAGVGSTSMHRDGNHDHHHDDHKGGDPADSSRTFRSGTPRPPSLGPGERQRARIRTGLRTNATGLWTLPFADFGYCGLRYKTPEIPSQRPGSWVRGAKLGVIRRKRSGG